jgi:Fe-S oxidoreductase
LKLVEMERTREYAWCCGAGGGCSDAFPEFAAWTAGERIEEAGASGAKAIVTACPGCERSFLNAAGSRKIKVFDVAELVQRAVG